MDNIDRHIINELTKNAQKSFLKIAEEMGISPGSVQKKCEKMKKTGIILRPTVSIDLSKIGYQGKVYLMITEKLDHGKINTIDALKRIRNIFLVAEIFGEFDVMAMAPFKDFADVIELVDKIRTLPSVSQVEIALTSDTSFPVTKYYSKMLLPETENDNSTTV
jgi:DNA-binding Lrp family transcriptional regulator